LLAPVGFVDVLAQREREHPDLEPVADRLEPRGQLPVERVEVVAHDDEHARLVLQGDHVALAGAVVIPLSPAGKLFGFTGLPAVYWVFLVVIVAAYLALVELTKRLFDRRW